jgi:hypothetical protein
MARVGYSHPSLLARQTSLLERQLIKEQVLERAVEEAKVHNAVVEARHKENPANMLYFSKVSESVPEGSVMHARQLHEERRAKVRSSMVNLQRVAKHFPFAVPSASVGARLPRLSDGPF